MRRLQWSVEIDGERVLHAAINRSYADGFAKIARRQMRRRGEKWKGRVKVVGR